ncbi:MAG: BrnA antitoxin family protein [Candidatus Microgenomates bacterium]
MKKLKKIPKFKNEDEERKFWLTHDSTDYINWDKAKIYNFLNLRPSTATISLRLPKWLLEEIKIEANKRDVPYQSLIKIFLADKLSDVKSKYLAVDKSKK